MNQELKNTFQYVNTEEKQPVENPINEEKQPVEDNQKLAEDFVTGLPSWDLEPPYATIRRVTRQ